MVSPRRNSKRVLNAHSVAGAILLTIVSQLGYFSGFLTQFWHSPLEPGMEFAAGKLVAHEENIVITENGAEMLSKRAAAEMPIIR